MPTKRKKGLVVTTSKDPGYSSIVVVEVTPHNAIYVCLEWLRRAGWRPTKEPAKWRVTFERVEEK